MTHQPTPDNAITRLVDEQLELAASKLPALQPAAVHPSPSDHEEQLAAHATLEDVLLGHAQAPPEMLDELAALANAIVICCNGLQTPAGHAAQSRSPPPPPKGEPHALR